MSMQTEITRIKNARDVIRNKLYDLEAKYLRLLPTTNQSVNFNGLNGFYDNGSGHRIQLEAGDAGATRVIDITFNDTFPTYIVIRPDDNTSSSDWYGAYQFSAEQFTNFEPSSEVVLYAQDNVFNAVKIYIPSNVPDKDIGFKIMFYEHVEVSKDEKLDSLANAIDIIDDYKYKTIKIDSADGEMYFRVNGKNVGSKLPAGYYRNNAFEIGSGITSSVANSATATASDILEGKTAVTKEGLVVGTNIGRIVECAFNLVYANKEYTIAFTKENGYAKTCDDTFSDLEDNVYSLDASEGMYIDIVNRNGYAGFSGATPIYIAYPDGRPVKMTDHFMPIVYTTIEKLPEELLAEI